MKEYYSLPASAELVAELDAIARRQGSREQVFDDLLTLSVCALAGGTREEEYLATVKPYVDGELGKRPIDRLVAVFGRIVNLMEETRTDILGDIFQGAITRGQNGQFFTPDSLCELMARIAGIDEVREEGASEGEHAPNGTETVSDPCCGSGRLLLAAAKENRNRYFVGQDIDHRCAKITAINLALWNLYGKVIWGNTLTNEVRRVYHTGFNGRGVIRVEEPSPRQNDAIVPSSMDPFRHSTDEVDQTPPPTGTDEHCPRQGSLFDDPKDVA